MTVTNHKFHLVILGIIVLSGLVRLVGLTASPPSVYVDETVIGYNAFTIAETGRDEYGKSAPVLLRSYGAFSAPLYTYLSVFLVKVFGLSTIPLRLFSVISGVCLVFIVGKYWGLTPAWLAALAPVLVFYSRGAFEGNLALVLFVWGFLIGIEYIKNVKNKYLLVITTTFLAVSMYAYLAERFLSPLIYSIFIIIASVKILRRKLSVLPIFISIVLFALISLPLAKVSFTSGANQRWQSLIPATESNQLPASFISRYFAYYSPQNLFSRPDPDRQRSFPQLSVFYWWWIFPFMGGLAAWLGGIKKWQETDWLILLVLLISPLPGTITKDYFSTLRVLPFFICLIWIIAGGFQYFGRFKYWLIIVFTLIQTTTLYYNFILLRNERAGDWLYPYQSLAEVTAKFSDKEIVIDNGRLKPFYIYYAYINRLDPKIVQRWHKLNNSEYYNYYHFTNEMNFLHLKIKPIDFREDIYLDQLLVADELAISAGQAKEHQLVKISQIENLDHTVAFNIYQTNPAAKCNYDRQKGAQNINPECVNYPK